MSRHNRFHGLIVLLILLLFQWPVLSSMDLNQAYKAVQIELEDFYQSIYNGKSKDEVIHSRNTLELALSQTSIPAAEKTFIQAKADMMIGKHFVIEDRIWHNPALAESYLRKARILVESLLKEFPSPEVYALASEIRGSLFLLNPLRSVFTHGTAARSLARKAEEADPANIDVLILLANQALYTPRLYGGSSARAFDLFLEAMDTFLKKASQGKYIDPVTLFTLYSGTGIAIKNLGDAQTANLWFDKALAIYPENPYILMEID